MEPVEGNASRHSQENPYRGKRAEGDQISNPFASRAIESNPLETLRTDTAKKPGLVECAEVLMTPGLQKRAVRNGVTRSTKRAVLANHTPYFKGEPMR